MEALSPHARHKYEHIEAEGPAVRPLDFPPPRVVRGVRVNALVVHPATGQRDILPGVIHRESYTNPKSRSDDAGKRMHNNRALSQAGDDIKTAMNDVERGTSSIDINQTSRSYNELNRESSSGSYSTQSEEDYMAYFPQRRLQDAIYGSVWACLVLKRHFGPAADDAARAAGLEPGDKNAPIVWEIVGRHVAIKMVEWTRVHNARGRLLEDPVKEIAAMQLIGTDHPNVLGSIEVLQDDDYLFSVMPYAKGGDLFGYVVRDTESRGGDGGMQETVARYWFKQILEVSK